MVDASRELKPETVKVASLATQQMVSIKQTTFALLLSAKLETIHLVVERQWSIYGQPATTMYITSSPKTSLSTILSTTTNAQMTKDAYTGNHVQERFSTGSLTSRSYNHGPLANK